MCPSLSPGLSPVSWVRDGGISERSSRFDAFNLSLERESLRGLPPLSLRKEISQTLFRTHDRKRGGITCWSQLLTPDVLESLLVLSFNPYTTEVQTGENTSLCRRTDTGPTLQKSRQGTLSDCRHLCYWVYDTEEDPIQRTEANTPMTVWTGVTEDVCQNFWSRYKG